MFLLEGKKTRVHTSRPPGVEPRNDETTRDAGRYVRGGANGAGVEEVGDVIVDVAKENYSLSLCD